MAEEVNEASGGPKNPERRLLFLTTLTMGLAALFREAARAAGITADGDTNTVESYFGGQPLSTTTRSKSAMLTPGLSLPVRMDPIAFVSERVGNRKRTKGYLIRNFLGFACRPTKAEGPVLYLFPQAEGNPIGRLYPNMEALADSVLLEVPAKYKTPDAAVITSSKLKHITTDAFINGLKSHNLASMGDIPEHLQEQVFDGAYILNPGGDPLRYDLTTQNVLLVGSPSYPAYALDDDPAYGGAINEVFEAPNGRTGFYTIVAAVNFDKIKNSERGLAAEDFVEGPKIASVGPVAVSRNNHLTARGGVVIVDIHSPDKYQPNRCFLIPGHELSADPGRGYKGVEPGVYLSFDEASDAVWEAIKERGGVERAFPGIRVATRRDLERVMRTPMALETPNAPGFRIHSGGADVGHDRGHGR